MKEQRLFQAPLLSMFTARSKATWSEYSGDVIENLGTFLFRMKNALEKNLTFIFELVYEQTFLELYFS